MSSNPPRRLVLLCIATAAVCVVLLGLGAGYRLLAQKWADNRIFAVLVDDQTLMLDGKTLDAFNADLQRLGMQHQQSLQRQMDAWVDQWLDDTFALALDAVPGYMDWYYSMPGSYTRLYYAVSGDLDAALRERLENRLLVESGFEQRLAEFDRALTEQLHGLIGEKSRALRAGLVERYTDRQVKLAEPKIDTERVIDVNSAMDRAFGASAGDLQRWKISSQASVVAGVGSFALLARHALLPRLMRLGSVQAARQVIAGFAARLAPRMAGAISIGGSAAAVAAPSGPGALIAGSIAFATAAGTIVITDFALLKAEEAVLRDEQARQLRDELVSFRESIRDQLQAQLHAAFAAATHSYWQGVGELDEQTRSKRQFHILDHWRFWGAQLDVRKTRPRSQPDPLAHNLA
ncbi:hypothetical protein HG264_06685 [Pseudomonas sp. gcc21]|uniref:hypothetical protein n=1 Tax=Pseudomonas sp. gcc21 TaxID=2726989 RepID=UPI0014512639|nr:hypothetical protein [Pseudomonas sp. gcc21]QJD58615.1 hypothetical protein HG264_06685 [Pseudomonas sp. gcc21]